MNKLSDQLSELASRTAKLEDSVAAVQEKDRKRLDAQKAELDATVSAGRAMAKAKAESVSDAAPTWWSSTRDGADQWFDDQRAKRAERRAEHDADKAEQNAEDAEADAADALDYALYAIDVAQSSLIDAALARADAEADAAALA